MRLASAAIPAWPAFRSHADNILPGFGLASLQQEMPLPALRTKEQGLGKFSLICQPVQRILSEFADFACPDACRLPNFRCGWSR